MIKGNKIKLRDIQIKDLENYRHWQIGERKWKEFDGPYYKKPNEEEVDIFIEKLKARIEENNWTTPRQRQVIADLQTDQFIGIVSWYWQSKETQWKSIGIIIYNENYWNKGMGYDALKLWVDYLFNVNEKLVRLDLRTWSGNKRMIHCAKKLGFVEEACFRKARIVDGNYYDSIGMGILREEWRGEIDE